ncbi:MAG: YhbY family RNA-binding protein [Candidatus Heimdallarchaeota archaeon]|nr:YhbY family RNA-binding protein [Candidatus Heimdallarchaeota archaeon]
MVCNSILIIRSSNSEKQKVSQIIQGKSDVQIGKYGLSETIYSHILKLLKKQEFMKIKFLPSYDSNNFDSDIGKLTQTTKSRLIDKRGRTIVIQKLPRKRY